MNRNTFFEILRTISLSAFVALVMVIVVLGIIQYQVNEDQYNKQNVDYQDIDPATLANLIVENVYLEQQNPDDFKYSLRLGYLYELKKSYDAAEVEYKSAIEKAPYYEYKPQYYLALLYLAENKLQKAQDMMDSIGEKPDKTLIKYKAEVYSHLGDKYYSVGFYEEAALKYEKAISYYKIINSRKYKLLNGNLASSYVYLADEKAAQGENDDAISYLKQAKAIFNDPIIKYKLALLLMNKQPYVAEDYFEQVYKQEPALINYDTYNKFLLKQYAMAQMMDKPVDAELYKYKIDQLKEYYDNNILSVDDLYIDDLSGKISVDTWKLSYKVSVSLKFQNVSKYPINSLYLYVVFKDGDKVLDTYSEQVIDGQHSLKVRETSPLINIEATSKKVVFKEDTKAITVQILASKGVDSYKLLLKEFTIKERIKQSGNPIKQFLRKLGFELL